jgi:hypothetical protein
MLMVVVLVVTVLTPLVPEWEAVVPVDIVDPVDRVDQPMDIPYQDFLVHHSQDQVAVVLVVIVGTAPMVPEAEVEQACMVKGHRV